MLTQTFLYALTALTAVTATPLVTREAEAKCTRRQRIAGGEGVIHAYAQTAPGATYEAFREIPFGIGGFDGKCITTM